ncbi:hypothetical protein [Methylopila turkensis]|uniref:Uncharacterized protein n=1 Tax=Methylopila turkensis TaxID=1437816 RepID=A0A9W6JPJ4_9HYPH|nr:hypothetical protein [Methylopila turkensis]GLK80043.1 hypothetical protein GCM10008174_17840 [Methylopila turkensis]
MSDLQTCLTWFVVAAGAPADDGVKLADQHIDAYVAGATGDRVQALEALKAALEAMKLDGRVADHISARLEAVLSSQRDQASADAAGGAADSAPGDRTSDVD